MPSPPELTVIVPVYNGERTLGRTLHSLDRFPEPARPSIQVVVVDDGSTDDGAGLIEAAVARRPAFDWHVIRQENRGLSAARNAALAAASGKWIFFLDADDELATDLLPILNSESEATSIGFRLEYRWESGRRRGVRPAAVSARRPLDVLSSHNPFQPSGLVFRRTCLDTTFDEHVDVVNDWLFWMQNPRFFERMSVRPDVTSALIHVHGNNMSSGYEVAGENRRRVSRIMLDRMRSSLTRSQRNNFLIQGSIGQLQAGERLAPKAFLRLPCSAHLYGKLCVYSVAAAFGLRATPYRRRTG